LHTKWSRGQCGDRQVADKAALDGLHDTLRVLANVCRLMKKDGDTLQVFQQTLEDVRSDIAQESTPWL